MRVLATHSIRQFPLHFPSRATPCATRFRTSCTKFVTLTSILKLSIFYDRLIHVIMTRRRLLRGYQHFKEYTLKMEAACSSETMTPLYQTEGCHSPEDHDTNYYIRGSTIFHKNKSIPAIYVKQELSPCCLLVYQGLASSLLPSSFRFDISYAFRVSHIRSTCSPHTRRLGLIK